MKSRKWRIGGILLAAVIFAGAVTGIAFADSDQKTGLSKDTLYRSFISKLAVNLGVDQDKVTAALDTTIKQMLDEAVQEGRLTQEQADKITANKDFGFSGLGFLHGKKHKFIGNGRNLDGIANALGMTTDQLKTELQSGKKMQQIVTGHGMTMDQFRQKMLELKNDEISKAVADGKITQDQANQILEKMEQHFNNQIPDDGK